MLQKLLQKRRNKHLQQIPPENLIPNKPIRNIKKGRRTSSLFIRMEQDLRNKWVFFWNALKGGTFPHIQTFPPKIIEEKNSLRNLKAGGEKRNRLQVVLRGLHIDKPGFSGEIIVEPFARILNYKMKRVVGGNIIRFLNQCISVRSTTLKMEDISLARMDDYGILASSTAYGDTLRIQSASNQGRFSLLRKGRKGRKNKNLLFSETVPRFFNQEINELRTHRLQRIKSDICSIYWEKKGTTVADFLSRQMQRYLYCNLYALHEMSIKQSRIKELHKNQYTERRKIGILYGNISKRILTRIMRWAKEEGGDLDSKFLSVLERRLDVVLKRILFFPTIKAARQWINQGNILVNNCVCTTPGYLLQPADCIHIRKKVRTTWKVGWWEYFSKIRNSMPFRGRSQKSFVKNIDKKESIQSQIQPCTSTAYKKERRFFLPPFLLRQWKEWTVLWGNFSNIKIKKGSGENIELHKWAENSYQWTQYAHNCFQNSALVNYFEKTQRVRRRRTAITSWLIKVHGYYRYLLNRKVDSFSTDRKRHVMDSLEKRRKNGKLTPQRPLAMHRKSGHISFFLQKCVNATALHQQQTLVADGLYRLRWSQIFVKRKTFMQKRKDWRYSCIKPMHIECSYKYGSAIFLYASQKFAWPSSINVFLLRKALL